MSEIPYFVRSKEVTTLEATDSIYLDDANSDIPKKISFTNFVTAVGTGATEEYTILMGGENNIDEDVPQLIGGINGVSKNSNTING